MTRPRTIWIVQAVLRNAASRPCRLCTMAWRSPTSEKSARPYMTMVASAITPNISGTRRRVMTRFPAKRSAWPRAKPARVQPLACTTRALSAARRSAGVAIAAPAASATASGALGFKLDPFRLGRPSWRRQARVGDAEAGDRPVNHRNEVHAARRRDDDENTEQRREQRLTEKISLILLLRCAHRFQKRRSHGNEEAAKKPEADEPAREGDLQIAVDDVDDALPLPELLHHRQLHEVERPEERIIQEDLHGNLEQPLPVNDVLGLDRANEGQIVEHGLAGRRDHEERQQAQGREAELRQALGRARARDEEGQHDHCGADPWPARHCGDESGSEERSRAIARRRGGQQFSEVQDEAAGDGED